MAVVSVGAAAIRRPAPDSDDTIYVPAEKDPSLVLDEGARGRLARQAVTTRRAAMQRAAEASDLPDGVPAEKTADSYVARPHAAVAAQLPHRTASPRGMLPEGQARRSSMRGSRRSILPEDCFDSRPFTIQPGDLRRSVRETQMDDVKEGYRVIQRTLHDYGEFAVPRQRVVDYLNDGRKRQRRGVSVPFMLLQFVVSAVTLLAHDNVVDVSQVERHFRGMLEGTSFEGYSTADGHLPVSGHKTLVDIDVVTDIWTFVNEVMLPLCLPDLNGSKSENTNRIMRYNRVVGGLQLHQMRRRKVNCAVEYPKLGPFDDLGVNPFTKEFSCYPPETSETECFGPGSAVAGFCAGTNSEGGGHRLRRLTTVSGRIEHSLVSKMRLSLDMTEPSELFSLVLHSHQGLERGMERVAELMNHTWIDEQSSWVGIKMLALNPDLRVYTSALVNIFFLPSGELIPTVKMLSFSAAPYYNMGLVITLDILFALLWLQLFMTALVRLITVCCKGGQRWAYCTNHWNWVDWLAALMGAVAVGFWIAWVIKLYTVRDAALETVLDKPVADGVPSEVERTYEKAVENLSIECAQFEETTDWFRAFVGTYAMVLILRFFKGFMAQPRLAIITNTIVNSMTSMIHFLIAFATEFLAFMFAGMFLFGFRMTEFSQPSMAAEQCMQVLFGDFDHAELAAEYPLSSFIWFFSFIVVTVMIMMEMTLAVIMEAYERAAANAGVQDSLMTQLLAAYRGFSERKAQVKDHVLLQVLNDLKSTFVTTTMLREACHPLQKGQAMQLLKHSDGLELHEDEQVLGISDAARMAVGIARTLESLTERLPLLLQNRSRTRLMMRDHLYMEARREAYEDEIGYDPKVDSWLFRVERRLDNVEQLVQDIIQFVSVNGSESKKSLARLEESLRDERGKARGMP